MGTLTADRIESALVHLRENLGEDNVADLLEQMATSAPRRDLRTALTAEQDATLARAEMPPVEMPRVGQRASVATWRSAARLMAEAYSTAEVAVLLGVGQSRIRQHVARRTLVVIKTSGGPKFPRYQFTDDRRILPGWETVAPRFPADVHPVAVEAFLTRPTGELDVDGSPVAPRDWLLTGGDPQTVADVADAAYRIP